MKTMTGKKTFLDRLRGFDWKAPALWVSAALAAYVHAQVLNIIPYTVETISWLFPLVLAAPGLLTMLLLRNGFRRWYRWAAICLLFTTTFPDSATAVLVVGETWALHRQWVTERAGSLFRFTRTRLDAPVTGSKAPSGTSGRQRKPKTA